jgi:hypothetical protein
MIEETKSRQENVTPYNYQVHQIIYNDGEFLIAWGHRDLANGEKWDRQIEKDAESGKLDFLIEEALSEKKQGILKEI